MKNKFLLPGLIIAMVGLVVAGGLVIKKMAERKNLGYSPAVGTSGTAEIPQESNMPLPNAENGIEQRSATIEPAGDTLTWAVYQNSEYGIGFEYPAQWKIEGAEIRDPASDAYIAVSRLENSQNLSFDEWWQANMIVGGRPTALYASKYIDINGVKAKILYQPEGKSGWHVHIADNHNNIISFFSEGSTSDNELFGHVLGTFHFIEAEKKEDDAYKENIISLKDGRGKASCQIKDIYFKNGSYYADVDLLRFFSGLGDCRQIELPDCGAINFYTSYYAEGSCGKEDSIVTVCAPAGMATIDESDKICTFKIAEDVEIMAVDLHLQEQYQKISLDKFMELLNNDPFVPDETFWKISKTGIYHIEIDNGTIIKIIDQYTP